MSAREPVEIPEVDWHEEPIGVFVVCPKCRNTLPIDHKIDDTGKITPSLDCPIPGCDFHDWGRLVGWEKRGEE